MPSGMKVPALATPAAFEQQCLVADMLACRATQPGGGRFHVRGSIGRARGSLDPQTLVGAELHISPQDGRKRRPKVNQVTRIFYKLALSFGRGEGATP